METMQAIATRRTIRRFGDEEISAGTERTLLSAGLQAPSAADARPWQMVVIRDRQTLLGMAEAMPGCDMLREATLGLLVCAEPAREKIPGFWPQDCACATEHMLLAAHDAGLGGCWVGLYPVEDRVRAVRAALGIPEDIIPFALCALGYPGETLPAEDRFDETRIHREQWQPSGTPS